MAEGYNPTAESPLAMSYQPNQVADPKPATPSPFGGQPGYQFKPEPISHGGAIAGLMDNVLRGIVNGHAMREANKAMQLKKKSDDLNQSYNQDAQRLYQLAHSGVDPKSPEYQSAQSAVNGSWGALQDFRGQLLEQQGGGKKKPGSKGKQGEQTNPLTALTDPNADPAEKAKAVYAISGKLGAPVFGQIASLNTPQAQQQRATQSTQAGTSQATAGAQKDQAELAQKITALTVKDKRTPEEDAQLDGLKKEYTDLNNTLHPQKMTATSGHRYSEDGKDQYEVDAEGNEVPNTRRPRSTASTTPKVGSFGDFITAAYGDKPTAKQYEEGRAAWAKSGAGTTTGTHDIAVPQPDGSIKLVQVQTSNAKSFPGAGDVPDTRQDGKPANPPTVVTQSFHGKSVPGLVEKGNVDIANRPNIDNGDGTHSSVFSMSFGTDKGEVLVPGVGDGKTYPARKLTPEEALDQYRKTGQNLGTFKDSKSADAYAQTLHEDQAKYGNKPTPASAPTRRERAPRPTSSTPAPSTPHGGTSRPGDTIGGRATPNQTKADEDVTAATKLNSLAVQAVQSQEPGQQRQLALALIKGMAGRVNMQEYAIYTRGYGVENTVDGLIKGIQSGRMAPGVVRQLARDAHANLVAAKAAQREAHSTPGTQKEAPAGASSEVYDKDGKTLIGHVVNGAYVALGKE
jgi:hypothetical protein